MMWSCFALNLLEVDQYGLDKIDRRILQTMIVNFQGGPVGLEDSGCGDRGGFRYAGGCV